jgi:tRNA modification GTPase
VIAIRGPSAERAVDIYFQAANGRSTPQQTVGKIVYGRWRAPQGEEVVVCRRAAGDLEVHCHGGHAAPAAILEDLQAAGLTTVPWTQFIDDEPDPFAVAVRVALSQAHTERTATILLDQLCGVLRDAFARVETLADSPHSDDRHAAAREIAQLLDRANLGLHLTNPWRVVIAGRPNVGKSSLINALLGYERAIVFETPGTTRDVLTALTAFDGWPVELTDTAGLRGTSDEIEAAGVERAQEQLATADLIILVSDLSTPWSQADGDLISRFPNAVIVHNKCDLAHATDDRPRGILTSAVTGYGFDVLERAIVSRVASSSPRPGDAVPFTQEHVARLQALQARLATLQAENKIRT